MLQPEDKWLSQHKETKFGIAHRSTLGLGEILVDTTSIISSTHFENIDKRWLWLFLQAEHPALAVTGENHPQELIGVLIQLGIVLFFYFIATPVSPCFSKLPEVLSLYICNLSPGIWVSITWWIAANNHQLDLEKMVQKKSCGDVFPIHVCLHFLPRVSGSINIWYDDKNLKVKSFYTKRKMFIIKEI